MTSIRSFFLRKAAANLVEPGEIVLVLNSGYFGDSFADWRVKVDVSYLYDPLICSNTVSEFMAPKSMRSAQILEHLLIFLRLRKPLRLKSTRSLRSHTSIHPQV